MKSQAIESPQGILVCGKSYRRRAWTGGDVPSAIDKRNHAFRALRSFFMREQLRECGGLDYWKCAGTSCMERARIFWGRATFDAWRTLNP
jgi:hypothetical protein